MVAAAPARSYLFAPADNERLVGKVFHAGADAVVLDLEDAVVPGRKEQARQILAGALHAMRTAEVPVYVRINPVGGAHWRADVTAAVSAATRGVRVAKAQSADELLQLDAALKEAERTASLPVGSIDIVPTIESAVGVLAAADLAKCPRVSGFCFGKTDFLNDIGAESDEGGLATLYSQSHLVLVSRVAGLMPPVASVHTDLADEAGLRRTTLAARQLGFFGRSCIHPKQLAIVHEVFTPSEEEVAKAERIVSAFDAASRSGRGAVQTDDGQFLDEAVVARARRTIALAERLRAALSQGRAG